MSNMRMEDQFSSDEIDEIIADAKAMGMKVPRTDSALKLAWVVMNRPMCHTKYDLETLDRQPTTKDQALGTTCDTKLDEVEATVCSNGCCVNFTAVPDHISMLGAIISTFGGQEAADRALRGHIHIMILTGMD